MEANFTLFNVDWVFHSRDPVMITVGHSPQLTDKADWLRAIPINICDSPMLEIPVFAPVVRRVLGIRNAVAEPPLLQVTVREPGNSPGA